MKKLAACFFCLFLISGIQAQKKALGNNTKLYADNFNTYLYRIPDADSLLFYIKKLASFDSNTGILKDLLHNSFAQEFRQTSLPERDTVKLNAANRRKQFCKELLMKLKDDSSNLLSNTSRPIYLWTKIQDNSNNVSELTRYTNEFIRTELSSGNLYENLEGRYGLLIHQIISRHTELKPLAENLLSTISNNLKNNQVQLTDSLLRSDLNKRAWFRYMYAYANYAEAKAGSKNEKEKEACLKNAFVYSPDLVDKNYRAAYFYEMHFLFGKEMESFQIDYINYIIHSSRNKEQVLSALLDMALVAPEFKSKLKEYYISMNQQMDFATYWNKAINKSAKPAHAITLNLTNRKLFDSRKFSGKWILVDFWGTWCVPCREEHPALQKFYDSVILQNNETISLLTIACRDKEENVLKYMNAKNYSFPVAISDNIIENTYSVQSYPAKILITPEERYVIVPFGTDWIQFVKQYCGL